MSNLQQHSPEDGEAIAAAASTWLARRDRGLMPGEQDAFLQWLREDPRHGQAFRTLEKTWTALDLLDEWRPGHSAQPNPDLLAPPARFRRRRFFAALTAAGAALAVAALVVLGVFFPRPPAAQVQPAAGQAVGASRVRVLLRPERQVLADGSIVELNRESRVEAALSATERRVRLVRGEAFFTVATDPLRPFIVEAGGIAVRAVGTAFNVRREAENVQVLVTEGLVEVERNAGRAAGGFAAGTTASVAAGERVVVDVAPRAVLLPVERVSARDIERALAWQGVQLVFEELPLSEVVAEFNSRNRQQLVIGDPAVAGLLVGGTFRADNVEAFARLLELSFGVSVEHRADGALVLRRRR